MLEEGKYKFSTLGGFDVHFVDNWQKDHIFGIIFWRSEYIYIYIDLNS